MGGNQQMPSMGKGLQMRPGSGADDRFYSPQRDIAWVFPQLAKYAMRGLSETHWEDWMRSCMEHSGTSVADLGEGAKTLAAAISEFANSKGVSSPEDALEKSGFMALPDPVKMAVLAELGKVFVGSFFGAIRDVTRLGERPLVQDDLDALVIIAEETAQLLRGDCAARAGDTNDDDGGDSGDP